MAGQARMRAGVTGRVRRGPLRRAWSLLVCVALAGRAGGALAQSVPPSPEPPPPPAAAAPASDLADAAAYLAALRLHVEPDAALATSYLSFWSRLAAGLPAEADADQWARLRQSAASIATSLQARYPGRAAPYRLLDTLPVALAALGTSAGQPEALVRLVDQFVTPRVDGASRYAFGGGLAGAARLDGATALWRDCRRSPACVATHDSLFAAAMGGVSLGASAAQRLATDQALAARPETAALQALLGAGLAVAGNPVAGSAPGLAGVADQMWSLVRATTGAEPDGRLRALLTLGSAAAALAGSPSRAGAFTILGQPLESRPPASAAQPTSWLGAAARLGLFLAGGHALALFDGLAAWLPRPAADSEPPQSLALLVQDLYAGTARDLAALRTEVTVASAGTDARLVALALAVDVLKDDMARVESTQQAQVRAAFQAAEGRRWTAFDEDNERCFALRNRDPDTGRLRVAEFRRCEDRFLQGAVRRSQYLTRNGDYLLDARYLEPADLQFPFHLHYPLLLTRAGTETRAALALPDPVDWTQQATALLRLYQDNPAVPADYPRRAEVLRQVRAAGARTRAALEGLVARRPAGAPVFDAGLNDRLLQAYFDQLGPLLDRVDELDDAGANAAGKRLTVGLDQPLPAGRQGAAVATRLSVQLAPCAGSAGADFRVPAEGVSAETRRFFDSPVTAAEVDEHWNQARIPALSLPALSLAPALPPPWAWLALEGLGTVDACLLEFRPETVDFSRTEGAAADSYMGLTDVAARLAVRFVPGPALAGVPGLTPGQPLALGEARALRRCTFAYSRGDGGCSRGSCLARLAPAIWTSPDGEAMGGGSCNDEPFTALAARALAHAPPVPGELVQRYWSGRARALATLEADVRRSTAFARASAAYREYFAYAAVALGSYADGGAALAPLLDPAGPLAPEGVLRARLDRQDPAALAASLAAERQRLAEAARTRGTQVVASGQLPALVILDEMLGRVDWLLSAYAG